MRKIWIACLLLSASPAFAGDNVDAPALGQVGLVALAVAVGLLGGRSIRKYRNK